MTIRRGAATMLLFLAPHVALSQSRSVQSGAAGATLPNLGAMTVTPSATLGGRTVVARTVSLSATVTNPDAMGTSGWCEVTVDPNRGWSKTGGTYAKGNCLFANIPLPPSSRAPLNLNVRACNAAGCKESPTPLVAEVDAVGPTVLTPLRRGDVGTGVTIGFSEVLPADQRQRIEAAISTVASHPVKFTWAERRNLQGNPQDLTIQSVSTAAILRQSVTLDLTDGVGNVTHGAQLVDIAAEAVALPDLAAAVVTPSATFAGHTVVGSVVTLSAAVTNPSAIEKAGGSCEMTRDKSRSWTQNGGKFVNGACTFPDIQLRAGNRGPVELNVRGCNPAGCKESPVWITAEVDATAPTVVTTLRKAGVSTPETIVFSEPLPADQKQRIEAAISAATDRPVQLAWTEPRSPAGIGENLVLSAPAPGAHFRRSVTLDLTDMVGNVTHGAVIIEVPTQAAELPNPGAVSITPMATVGGHVSVARTITLTATVSNPTAMAKDGWCEMAAQKGAWRPNGGKYAGGVCTFNQITLPGSRAREMYELNVRACSSVGCKESPAWITAEVDETPPSVTTPITVAAVGSGATVVFSEPLPADQQRRVEAAMSAATDHPVNFTWSERQPGFAGVAMQVVVHSVAAAAHFRQSVSVDIADGVGNVTHAAKVVSVP